MRESTLWLLHILTAVILVAAVGVHLSTFSSIMGQGFDRGLEWVNVVARGRNPFYAALYLVFLGAALYHGLYGLRSIILEVTRSPVIARLASVTLTALGVAAYLYGAYGVLVSLTLAA